MPRKAGLTRRGKKKIEDKILAQKMRRLRFIAKLKVPVDTGNLRSGISISKRDDVGWNLDIDVPYAAYVEYGTSKMQPQPYVRPAIQKVFKD